MVNNPFSSGGVPAAADNIVVKPGHTLTVNTSSTCNNLTVRRGGVVSISTGEQLQINGRLKLNNQAGQTGALLTGDGTCRQNGTSVQVNYGGTGALGSPAEIAVSTFILAVSVTIRVNDDGFNNEDLIISSVCADEGDNDRLTKTGLGTLTLSGSNTFQRVNLNAGQLNINHAQALGDLTSADGALRIANGTSIDNTSGGTITSTISKRTFVNGSFNFVGTNDLSLGTGSLKFNGDHTVTVDAGELTFNGIVKDVGNNDRIIKQGNGTLTLTGANTMSGVTIDAGQLNINNPRALGNLTTPAAAFIINGGRIDNTSGSNINLNRAYKQTWNGNFEFIGTNNLNMNSGAVSISNNVQLTTSNNTFTVRGTLSGTGQNLSKAGGGTFTLGTNDMTVNDLTLQAGIINMPTSGATAFISGDLSNNSTLKTRTGKVHFNSGATQGITGSVSTNFYDMEISGGSLIETTTQIKVKNQLDLTSGQIDLQSNRLIIGNSTSAIGTLVHSGSANDFIYGGEIRRFFGVSTIANKGSAGHFPLGTKLGKYRPLYVSAPSTAPTTGGTITLSHTTANTSSPVSVVSVADGSGAGNTITVRQNANWTITSSGVVGGSYQITMGGEGFGTIASVNDLRVMRLNSVIGTAGTNGGSSSNIEIQRTDLTLANLIASFYIGSTNSTDSPLPVELSSFKVISSPEGPVISWVTEAEINHSHFVLERSYDGIDFHEIKRVEGQGNFFEQQVYEQLDEQVESDWLYYRLVQVDEDGSQSISPIISIKQAHKDVFQVFPNPLMSGQTLTLHMAESEQVGQSEIHVFDSVGKLLHRQQWTTSSGSNEALIHGLVKGIYLLRITDSRQNTSVHKIIVQ